MNVKLWIVVATVGGALWSVGIALPTPADALSPARTTHGVHSLPVIPSTAAVYAAGDSTMEQAYLPYEATYVAQLSQRLCGSLCNTVGYPTVVNVAHGGLSCFRGLSNLETQWPSIVNATPTPTTIIVSIGMNDAGVTGVTNQQIVDCWNYLYFNPTYGAVSRGIRIIPIIPPAISSSRTDVEPQLAWERGWLGGYFGASACADWYSATKNPSSEWINWGYSWDNNVHPGWVTIPGLIYYTPIGLIQ